MLINEHARGIGFLVTDVSHLLRKVVDRRLHPHGLTRAQWAVLASIANTEGMTQSDLADALEIEKPTAGRLIDHMEQRGWVVRRAKLGDRRSRGLYLSEKAKPLIAGIQQVVLRTRVEALLGVSTEERRVLSGALDKMKVNLRTALTDNQ